MAAVWERERGQEDLGIRNVRVMCFGEGLSWQKEVGELKEEGVKIGVLGSL